MKRPPEKIVELIAARKRFLLATHINPDGDALGSLLGLGSILKTLGKEVYLYSEEPVPYIYRFLPGHDLLGQGVPETMAFDGAIALDCGDQYRLGKEMEALLRIRPFLVLDHHFGHKEFGDHRWVDASRSSTGEMVYDLAKALGAQIPRDAAFCLYTAIASDTGVFRYPSTSPDTFEVARELVLTGVNPAEVAGKLFENYTVRRFNLLRETLATLELYAGDRIAVTTVTRDMLDKTGTTLADTEHFINYSLALGSVLIAAIIRQPGQDGRLSVSLRSKGDKDVARVAALFGGGGHRNASGFRLQDRPIAEVKEKLLQELKNTLGNGQ